MQAYLREHAEKLGLTILESPVLGKILTQQAKLVEESEDTDLDPEAGDCVVDYGHDADSFMGALDVIAMCLKHPGRRTWVIADYDSFGMTFTAVYAEDSVRAATKRARKSLENIKKLTGGSHGEDSARA